MNSVSAKSRASGALKCLLACLTCLCGWHALAYLRTHALSDMNLVHRSAEFCHTFAV